MAIIVNSAKTGIARFANLDGSKSSKKGLLSPILFWT